MKNDNWNELLHIALERLKREEEKEQADGCIECAYFDREDWELPCCKCKRAAKDYWRAK